MKVSTKACYALQIMVDLALHESEGYISIKNISQRRDIDTVKYLEQIVAMLQKAGLVKSLRGNSGGYKLSRPANRYTIGEILRVTEGNLAPIACLDDTEQCARSSK